MRRTSQLTFLMLGFFMLAATERQPLPPSHAAVVDASNSQQSEDNPVQLDVNQDGVVSPADALVVIEYLNQHANE